MRLVLPAAVIRSAPEDGVLVDDEVGLRSPELSVVDTLGFGSVLCKTRKHMLWNGIIGAKGRKKKQYSRGCLGTRRGSRRGGLGDSKLARLSINSIWIFRVLDKVNLVASPGYEPPAGWRDGKFELITVDKGSEELRATW